MKLQLDLSAGELEQASSIIKKEKEKRGREARKGKRRKKTKGNK